ncbi:hypothetical protein PIB30_008548, partial [Stylosanthes scabra]|nr:hypothetical protein [Stylosanthes scabra]
KTGEKNVLLAQLKIKAPVDLLDVQGAEDELILKHAVAFVRPVSVAYIRWSMVFDSTRMASTLVTLAEAHLSDFF